MHAALTRTSIGVILFGQLDDVIMSDASTWLPAERRREVIARACQRGAEREAEPWGKRHALQLRHVVLGGPLGRALRLDRGPLPWDGGRATVRQASMFEEGGRPTTFAAVYHFVTSLGADTSWTNMPAGAREAPWSQWYTSGLSHWLSGTYRRLTPALRGSLEVTLQPA
jgi:acyl-homoserine lactone acylase PvdQ